MDFLVVVPAQFLLLVQRPASQRDFDVPVCVLAADHEPDLAGRIGGDRGICVFDRGEDFLAGFLELGDEGKVQPLVLGYIFGKRGGKTGGKKVSISN